MAAAYCVSAWPITLAADGWFSLPAGVGEAGGGGGSPRRCWLLREMVDAIGVETAAALRAAATDGDGDCDGTDTTRDIHASDRPATCGAGGWKLSQCLVSIPRT